MRGYRKRKYVPADGVKYTTKKWEYSAKNDEIRASFIVNEILLEKIKTIAANENLFIKELINGALQDIVTKYEAEHGIIELHLNKTVNYIVINDLKYYSIHETAKILSMADQTVRNWVKDKKLKKSKFGNHVLICETEIEKYTDRLLNGTDKI